MKAIVSKSIHLPSRLEYQFALSPPPSDRSPKIFVPFFCERDSMGKLLPSSKKKETPYSPPPKSLLLPKLKLQKPESLLTKIYKDSLINPTPSRNNSIPSICEPSGSILFQEKSWKSRNYSIGDNKENLGNYDIFRTPKKSQQKISQLQLQKIVTQQKESSIKAPETSLRTIRKLRTLASITNLGAVKSTKEIEACEKLGTYNSINEEEGGETERTIKGGLSECRSQPNMIKTEKKKRIAIKKIAAGTGEVDSGSPYMKKKGKRNSAIKIVANNSYFKVIKTEDDKGKYLENQKAFQNSVVKIKQRINDLRSNIGENFVPIK